MRRKRESLFLVIMPILLGAGIFCGQNAPPAAAPPPTPGRGGAGRSAYPQRPPADPAVLERGRGLYSVNCAFCHGSDARGGEGGPNLLRSTSVLNDRQARTDCADRPNGRPNAGMPKINLTAAQITDIAAYLHSFPVGGRDVGANGPPTLWSATPAGGNAIFRARCGGVPFRTGDLKGLARECRIPRPCSRPG